MLDLRPLGDRAWLAHFASETEAQAWGVAVRAQGLPGVIEVSVAYTSAAVYADLKQVEPERLERWLRELPRSSALPSAGRRIRIPILYDGVDLDRVAALIGETRESVVSLHAGQDYQVFAIGFLPGFPYAGYLNSRLAGLPRHPTPRASVPAGSVAIAGRQTGIYPISSPGGWLILGRTPLRIVDLRSAHFPIEVGDRLCFEPIDEGEYHDRMGMNLEIV